MAGDIAEVLHRAGIPIRESGTNVGREHVNICCPFCFETRFHCGIHQTDGWFFCWVCGAKGQWGKLRKVLRKEHGGEHWGEFTPGRTSRYVDDLIGALPAELEGITRDFVTYNPERMHRDDLDAWEYLVCERGLEAKVIQLLRPGIGMRGPYEGDPDLRDYVTFREGDHLIARSMYADVKPRWYKSGKRLGVWGLPWVHMVSPEWVIVTEGVFDALAVPVGYGVAILGSVTSSIWLDLLAKELPRSVKDICLALDPGAKRETTRDIRIELKDLGFGVQTFDWRVVKDLVERDPKFDLDKLRLSEGRDYVLQLVLESLGVVDDQPLI